MSSPPPPQSQEKAWIDSVDCLDSCCFSLLFLVLRTSAGTTDVIGKLNVNSVTNDR